LKPAVSDIWQLGSFFRGRKLRVFFFAATLFALPVFLLPAREVVITVEDADLGIAMEGALVHSWDGKTQECDGEGKVRIEAPDDRQVVVQVRYPGYETGRIVLVPGVSDFTLALRLGGVMENRELVVEARKPGAGETKTGRSVAISGRELSRTAEIGVLEDVMTSIKLLPGVGYSGSFNAMPSIRGGFPGDLMAVLDGFYIERPYHWGGISSIFDPKMVESARLSHGVFSSRYGYTTSGLLEVSSRKPSAQSVELDIGVSTSAASMSLSHPLGKDGALMLMGKTTYWDPFIWGAKQFVEEARYITTAPYIRSGALTAWYRVSPDLRWTLSGFFGSDGIGVLYENENQEANMHKNKVDMRFFWDNKLGFLTTGLAWNPTNDMMFKASVGMGILQADLNGDIVTDISVDYPSEFLAKYPGFSSLGPSYDLYHDQRIYAKEKIVNYQGRLDFDWDLGQGFLFALGAQELYSQWIKDDYLHAFVEREALLGPGPGAYPVPGYTGPLIDGYIGYYVEYPFDVRNHGYTTSGYTLMEYTSDNKRFGAELGLRVDHMYFVGRDFTIQTRPVLNPRLNLDFGVLQGQGVIDSLNLSLGTGLFSSMNGAIQYLQKRSGIDNYEMRQNRSWTSVAGTKIDFIDGLSFNIEGYFKYIFDRAYIYADTDPVTQEMIYKFNGVGRVWGFDLMLQKFTSRWWDGWISYSFNHARYKNPGGSTDNISNENEQEGPDWFFPSFHRFHTLNLVLNLKPVKHFNIATRLSFASGTPRAEVGNIETYPILINPGSGPPDEKIIAKYKRKSWYSDTLRNGFSLPLDVKFSFFHFNKNGKVQSEIYFAIENLQSLFYTPKRNSTFNPYTGKEEEGSSNASYEMPIPMPSFGFKWSY
jgi:hypothetical protein